MDRAGKEDEPERERGLIDSLYDKVGCRVSCRDPRMRKMLLLSYFIRARLAFLRLKVRPPTHIYSPFLSYFISWVSRLSAEDGKRRRQQQQQLNHPTRLHFVHLHLGCARSSFSLFSL
jgi:hypothetical protein